MAKGVFDIAAIYMFLKRLVTPFEQWDAYKTGLIDKDGKVIVPKNERTQEQNKSYGYFDRLVANLKKLMAKIPGGKTRIASFAAALLLLKEKNLDPDDIDYLEECLNHYMKEATLLYEEVPTVSASGGEIAGIGVGPKGEPGLTPAQVKKHKRRVKKTKEQLKKAVNEKWSEKYKRSIDCENPKGFSQKAHCQGKQKKNA